MAHGVTGTTNAFANLQALDDPAKLYKPLRSKSPGSPMRQEAMRASLNSNQDAKVLYQNTGGM